MSRGPFIRRSMVSVAPAGEAQGIIVGCFSRRRRHLRRNLREFQLFAAVGLRENHAGAVVALVRHITSQYFFILFMFF
jgi:hypothetical protein